MSSGGDPAEPLFASLGNDNIAPTPFYVLTWIFFGLCIVALALRAYVRYVCFRRLVLEDYLMLFALALHSAEAVLIQIYAEYIYDIEAVDKGDTSRIGPDFFANAQTGLRALGASLNMAIVGILIVKLNFLIFFKRLGESIHRFNIAWWLVTIFTIGGAAAQIGMQQFGCFFGTAEYIFSEQCGNDAALRRTFINAIFSAAVDAVSDILIVCLPIWILWGSGISLRKKLALTFVFGLVWLTVAITIVRGSIFHQQYTLSATGQGAQSQSGTFTWFWFYVEFSVAFIIACMVSFRALFVQRERARANNNKSSTQKYDEHQQRREAAHHSSMRRHVERAGWRAKVRQLQDSVLDTCRTLEDWPGSDETLAMRALPTVPSGLMTVDFQDDGSWKGSAARTTAMALTSRDGGSEYHPYDRLSGEGTVSQRSLLPSLEAAHLKQSVGVARA